MFLLYGPADRWDDAFADEGRFTKPGISTGRRSSATIAAAGAHGRGGHSNRPSRSPDTIVSGGFCLGEEERAELVAHWRARFVQAQQPGFMFCVGFAKPSDTTATWLKGAAARRAHYRWAGIPRSLLKEWRTQRRRRGRIVRELEEATTSPEPAPAA
jgi:hypothetical protein